MTAVAGPAAVPFSHVEECMGTVFSFRVAAPGMTRTALTDAIAWLHAIDALFSTYRSDSEISHVNTGILRLADASPEVRYVLAECDRLRDETDGYFSARLDGRLDPSGYVKGWAVQHAANLLAAAGSVNHCVNGGGDVFCAGRPEPGRGWRIGITDPHQPRHLRTTVEAAGPVAVATSGLAERGAHILDPHIGQPATDLASVTVIAPDLLTADVYATAAVAMGPQRAAAWLSSRPNVRALLIDSSAGEQFIGDWIR